jgi:hypothetical protein
MGLNSCASARPSLWYIFNEPHHKSLTISGLRPHSAAAASL